MSYEYKTAFDRMRERAEFDRQLADRVSNFATNPFAKFSVFNNSQESQETGTDALEAEYADYYRELLSGKEFSKEEENRLAVRFAKFNTRTTRQ